MMILQANYQCVINGVPQTCTITYNPLVDPYAVHLLFVEAQAQWIFGRDLFKEAVAGEAGEGNVKIRMQDQWYIINFAQDDKSVDVYYDRKDMLALTEMLYSVVPEGQETNHVDWEQELGKLI
jgi:hypothetical protein